MPIIDFDILLIHLTKSWLNDLIKLGNRKVLDVEDLYDPIKQHSIDFNTQDLEKYIY